ncbi:hypothetical protein GCM10023153_08620 [Ornithinibacter aureus]|uniref:Uncharacterized protein n=1 Tax=Ornithinibacter aureus TaxID=622664 RepID=A0ABP8JI16_9MICO
MEDGGPTHSVLWPVEWTAEVAGTEAVIRDPTGDMTIRTGDEVELAGGFLSEGQYEPQRCATGAAWQVVGVMRHEQ